MIFWPFLDPFQPLWALSYWKAKRMHKMKKLSPTGMVPSVFFIFSLEMLQNGQKKIHLRGCPKLCAHFNALCMHTRTCMHANIIKQIRRPILKYAESFVKIWRHLAETLMCVTSVTYKQTDTARIYIRWISSYGILDMFAKFQLSSMIKKESRTTPSPNSYLEDIQSSWLEFQRIRSS